MEIAGEAENPKKVYEEVKKEVQRIKKCGFDEEEVTVIKNALYGKFLRKLNDVESIASDFAGNAFLGGEFLKYGEYLLELDGKKLADTLNEGFCESTLSQVLPMETAGGGK